MLWKRVGSFSLKGLSINDFRTLTFECLRSILWRYLWKTHFRIRTKIDTVNWQLRSFIFSIERKKAAFSPISMFFMLREISIWHIETQTISYFRNESDISVPQSRSYSIKILCSSLSTIRHSLQTFLALIWFLLLENDDKMEAVALLVLH
jgi:hypothetical protein